MDEKEYPLVSIVCVCKDRASFLGRCIDSILAQDYPNLEVLVQDGASTDGSVELLRSYGDRIQLVSEPDSGPGEAFVRVLSRVNGELFASCLSDEELMPGAVSWGVDYLTKHRQVAAVYGDYYTSDTNGNIISQNTARPWDFEKYLCCEVVPPLCSTFFRTSAYRSINYHEYTECGEFDIWLRLGVKFPIRYQPGLISKFARHEGSNTCQVSDYYKTLPGRIQAIERLVQQADTAVHIKKLRERALAGLHLWYAHSFINLGAFDDVEKQIIAALQYAPNLQRLNQITNIYIQRLDRAGERQRALSFIECINSFQKPAKDANRMAKLTTSRETNGLHSPSADGAQKNVTNEKFSGWIEAISDMENRLYFRDQSVISLDYLTQLVHQHRPTKVIELGTLSGLSLRTWLNADPDLTVTAVDLSFASLKLTGELIPLDLSRVTLLERDIMSIDFPSLWHPGERVLFFVDAHDMPGVPIMDHVLRSAIPKLPDKSLVVVDDLWYSQDKLHEGNIHQFFNGEVIHEIDPLQCFHGHYASYWCGGSFVGFPEVIPLMEWVNANRIHLSFLPGCKSVAFTWSEN